jgi:hypothetical protein
LAELPDGEASFTDYLEHTGNERRDIEIVVGSANTAMRSP